LEHRYFLFAAPAFEIPALTEIDTSWASPIEVAPTDSFSRADSADPNTELTWQKNQDSLDFGVQIADGSARQVPGSDSSSGLTAEGEFSGEAHGSSPSLTPAVPQSNIDPLSSSQGQSVALSPDSSQFDWLLGSATTGLRAEGESNWGATNSGQTKAITETHVQAANTPSLPAASNLPWLGQAVDSAIQILSVQQPLAGASISDGNQHLLPWEIQAETANPVSGEVDLDWDGWLNLQATASQSESKPDDNREFIGNEPWTLEHRQWTARVDRGQVSLQRISASSQNLTRGWQVNPMVEGGRLANSVQGYPTASVKGATQHCDAGQIDLGEQQSDQSMTGKVRRGQAIDAASISLASSVPSMYREFDLAGVDSASHSSKFESQVVLGLSGSISDLPESAEDTSAELLDESATESRAADEAVLSGHSTWLPLGLLTLGGLMLTSRRKHMRAGKPGNPPELA